ncbi:MAG: hypothetical protein COY69_00860 [Candidatus Magasanikbacteria bacterium CG_4_10_14_0_8_um_filter_32_14]|uniref:Exostosin GT47 domain-containing protein n=2 Tax=Candidatus Magasanikiibacteriota TaxID=1752731 RepID=A0A2M7R9Z5_9BACT|nr:MAG: hypothetical protein AUJ23_01165 [Candidatus Magasanikbacteria bacterium CG1_02_32_51]PIY93599.1 MAG: hypothetical protein COY69_00860 [Candidatus Magasanikbacteria bacterium CG_4_10_14_0_8_um_filter_32_14]
MNKHLSNFIFKIYRIIGRLLIKYSFNSRPSSLPFITGDGFRNIADYIFDDTLKNVVPEKVKEGQIIFVGDSNIKRYFREIHNLIKVKYIIITHNGDEFVDKDIIKMMDEKIIHWYGINIDICNDLVTPLPIGIGNKHFFVTGIPLIFKRVILKNYFKKNKIFYLFTVATNRTERENALECLKKNYFAETIDKMINFNEYLHLSSKYKFIASPPGSCVEGHRTWEAIYTKSIPIVKRSITTEYFEKIGLPIWVINDWSEIDQFDETGLAKKYDEIMTSSDLTAIYIDYWFDKIYKSKL